MRKYSSSLIIGFAIIVGFTILGLFLASSINKESSNVVNENRYELVPIDENRIIIFDKEKGEAQI